MLIHSMDIFECALHTRYGAKYQGYYYEQNSLEAV